MKRPSRRAALGALVVTLTAACGGSSRSGPDPNAFDDHTVSHLKTVEELMLFADRGLVPIQVKFVFTRFDEPEGLTYLYDSTFYQLHDEWYWFRLLNGQPIDGVATLPEEGLAFETIEEVYETYQGVANAYLPLDLRWVSGGERLYSPRFYELGLWDEPRLLGLGSILHYPAHPERVIPDDLWLFELEYVDGQEKAHLSPELVARFFERVEAALPEALRSQVLWLLRSEEQKAIAQAMVDGGDPLGQRVITYADLVVAGEVQVYNPGISAGYVKRIEAGQVAAATLHPNHVVLLEEVPDYLPPVAAILSAVPQTPLAHLNLLAASRGTPNAYVAGLMDIEGPSDWETWKTPTLVRANEAGVHLQPLAKPDYEAYLALLGVGSYLIPVAEIEDAPDFFDLRIGGLADVSTLVPLTGGKAAAMMALVDDPDIPTPHAPMAVTVRPFVEHMEPLAGWIEAMADDPDFIDDGRVRFVALEGEEDFREENSLDPDALAWLDAYLDDDAGSPIRSLVDAGGLKRVIRDQPLNPEFEAALVGAIESQFEALDPIQGLRFRSSSTAEDAPGFNGAGLYDSNTGYRDPSLQASDLSKRTLGWALLKTWASYWGYEAFEERRLAGIDHDEGRMGVLVHPRFDDPLEVANGVISFQLAREEDGDVRTMVVNSQDGALSVTNPDPDHPALPAIDQVSAVGDATPVILRVQGSSEVTVGADVLDDEALLWLFSRLDGLAGAWLDNQNDSLPEEHARSTVALDLEFKDMAAGWPAMSDGEALGGGLVLKQVRTLDRAIRADETIAAMPIPRDVLEQAHRVVERTCAGDGLALEVISVYTDPAVTWCLDHAKAPFDARFHVAFDEGIATLGIQPGHSSTFDHLDATAEHAELAAGGGWDLQLQIHPSARGAIGFSELAIDPAGHWTLSTEGGEDTGTLDCDVEELMLSPEAFLETLVDL